MKKNDRSITIWFSSQHDSLTHQSSNMSLKFHISANDKEATIHTLLLQNGHFSLYFSTLLIIKEIPERNAIAVFNQATYAFAHKG